MRWSVGRYEKFQDNTKEEAADQQWKKTRDRAGDNNFMYKERGEEKSHFNENYVL